MSGHQFKPLMRPMIEVQRMHDTISFCPGNETLRPEDRECRLIIQGNLNALCWVLNHKPGEALQELVDHMREAMAVLGLQEHRIDEAN